MPTPTPDPRPDAPPDDPAWAERAAEGLGVYVHVPFCSHRCGYCDFAAFAGLDDLAEAYVDAVVREIGARVTQPAGTVFVGGGTPSLLAPHLLARLLAAVPRTPGAEVTVEMNPESAREDVLAAAAGAGANRISMGMQSAVPHVLGYLERRHDPDAMAGAVERARDAGIRELNLDLVFGAPNETDDDWRSTLDAALDLGPDHLSCYALTVEAGTPLGRDVAAGRKAAPDDDTLADRLTVADERLSGDGYVRYEISNWARGRPCLHNLRYWSFGAYFGVGCAAHSYDPSRRRRSWNLRHPKSYVDAERLGGPGALVAGGETLDRATQWDERVSLGLRLACGLPLPASTIPQHLVDGGFVRWREGRVSLTPKGMATATAVATEICLAGEAIARNQASRHDSGGIPVVR